MIHLVDNFTIKAPNARIPNISPNSPVEDRINYDIYNENQSNVAVSWWRSKLG